MVSAPSIKCPPDTIILPGPPQPMLENKSQEEQIQELEGSDDEDEDARSPSLALAGRAAAVGATNCKS